MLRTMLIVLLLALPSVLVFCVGNFPSAMRRVRAFVERSRPPAPRPQGPPIERLAADLRRISANLDALVAAGPIPGRILRVQSTTAAYDQTLLMACRALDVEPGGTVVPLSGEQRLRTEAAVVNAGLRW